MPTPHIAVLYNSRSGTAVDRAEIAAAFQSAGARVTLLPLPERGSGSRAVRDALAAVDVVAAAGGDGTISSVAGLLYASRSAAALGLLPMGTCNDLSRALDVPADLAESVAVIVDGAPQPIDLIETDSAGVFINQANGGFAGALADSMDADVKAAWGPLAYWRTSLEVLQEMQTFQLTLETEGERLELPVVNLSVANASYSGGGVPLAPQADPGDGLMDVVIVESQSRLALARLLPRVLSGTHLDAEGVRYLRASKLTVQSRPPMPFSVDGEVYEEGPTRFSIIPRALRVMRPA